MGDIRDHYLKTPLGRLLMGCVLGAAALLVVQHALHFEHLVIEHRFHILIVAPYVFLLVFPIAALLLYRREFRETRRSLMRIEQSHDGAEPFDIVCKMKVDPLSSPGERKVLGRKLHFCSAHCLEKFDRDPMRYLSE